MTNRKIKAELQIDGKDNSAKAFQSVAVRLGQMERRMAQFNRTAGDFNRKVEAINRATSGRSTGYAWQQVNKFGDGMESAAVAMRAGMAGLGAAAVGSGVKAAIVDFAELERQMTRIGLTAGVSKDETDAALVTMKTQAKELALPLNEAVDALQTMTSAGMDFKDAMAFLPSVLATTQAAGSSSAEMASTTVQAAGALKISAAEMQRAFDMINEAGKAGSFEAKDMATYLPGLANGFSALGYKGTDAIGEISAYMQTLRAHTADASTAANQMENVLSKMYSQETANKFKDFGIDLEREMKKRTAAGQKPLAAFIELSRQAVNGDLSKLSRLFGDMQVQAGMRSLISDADTYKRVMEIINSSRVDGSVQRDNQRILGETKASIDRLAESFSQLKTSFGNAVAPIITPILDQEVKSLDIYQARQRGMEKRGWSWARRQLGVMTGNEPLDLAYEGGYRDPAFLAEYWQSRYGRGLVDPTRPKASKGRHNLPIVQPEFPGGGHGYSPRNLPTGGAPVPLPRPSASGAFSSLQEQYLQYGGGRQLAVEQAAPITNANVFRGFEERLAQAAQATADSGERAGQSIEKGAASLDEAGSGFLDGLRSLIGQLQGVANQLASTSIKVETPKAPNGVNANTGRSMPPGTFGP